MTCDLNKERGITKSVKIRGEELRKVFSCYYRVCVIQDGDTCPRTEPGVSRMMRVISDIPSAFWPCKNMFCDSLSLKCVAFA